MPTLIHRFIDSLAAPAIYFTLMLLSTIPLSAADKATVTGQKPVQNKYHLEEGQVFEITVRVDQPSQMFPNARLRVSWDLLTADDPDNIPRGPDEAVSALRNDEALGIYTTPTANWSKVLHALDSDVYLNYRAPVSGTYSLTITAEEGSVKTHQQSRWREPGNIRTLDAPPLTVAWPKTATVAVSYRLHHFTYDYAITEQNGIEFEPNDTPELAQPILLPSADTDSSLSVLGSADDIEYFDNGDYGRSGDDWFRIDFQGKTERLLTACLSIPDQQVAARIRVYRVPLDQTKQGRHRPMPGHLIPLEEYSRGLNENERSHQQQEQHRIAVNRILAPGETYFLRVEANSPAYDLELRYIKPAPYTDPRQSIRHALYDHIGQVDAWLTNRPRGASVDRRIRDSGNLLGTNCMSCHTQSGVWGPAVALENGYSVKNVQLFHHLINTCYQSLRPTNVLKDAANNTSLAPLDLGDGPAGTRVAGHAIVALERFMIPRKLQSKQQLRTANFILQSADPGGINAAGPGANVGQGVVYNYTGEILANAWLKQKEERFFRALEEKAAKMLTINVKYADDLGHRIEFFKRYFPQDYVSQATKLAQLGTNEETRDGFIETAKQLQLKIDAQVAVDLERLLEIQLDDGGWGFNPGTRVDGSWTVPDITTSDPSPTSTSLLAFHALGMPTEHEAVKNAIAHLVRNQRPTGMWKLASQTGFVSTSYALNALSRYYPEIPQEFNITDYELAKNTELSQIISTLRRGYIDARPELLPLAVRFTGHRLASVRYYAFMLLGRIHQSEGVDSVVTGLGDRSKQIREAAHWALRQTLIDDHGWPQVFKAAMTGDDYQREAAIRALVMKVDSELPDSQLDHAQLTSTLNHALNLDPHPAVRAWATRSAWQWWVWNPATRPALNDAWVKLLTRPETNALAEVALRYQSHALFVANGHVANGSRQHQYKHLAELFSTLREVRDQLSKDEPVTHHRLTQRLVAIAATFHKQRGGDGGPGQLGYTTPFANELFGSAILDQLKSITEQEPLATRYGTGFQATLEGAANIPNEPLQQLLVDYSINGPEHIRPLASESISDPRLVSLVAVPEQLEPMIAQLWRGAMEPPRRPQLSEPILKMFAKVGWIIPESEEQKNEILHYLIPDLTTYQSPTVIEAIEDTAAKATALQQQAANWYVADRLGQAVAENPDLHFENLVTAFPETINHDTHARFWLQSIPWILQYKTAVPKIQVDAKQLPPIDPYEELRTRALSIYIAQLSEKANPQNRKLAVDLANKTSMKRNPEILVALDSLIQFETAKDVLDNAKKVLSQSQGEFQKSLVAAITKEPDHGFSKSDQVEIPDDFFNDIVFFRDYVMPEMTKVLRGDERSCMICHGEPGRVPSMELFAPDQVGFLSVEQLLVNYRILQHRVDTNDIMSSKLLRKPLNVQSGKEDGHQGGRRYQPNDPGYLILKAWIENQVVIQDQYGLPERDKK